MRKYSPSPATTSRSHRVLLSTLAICLSSLPAPGQSWVQTPASNVGDVAAGEGTFILIVDGNGELQWSGDGGQNFKSYRRRGVKRVSVGVGRLVYIADTEGSVWFQRGNEREWIQTDAVGMSDVAVGPHGEVACTATADGAVWLSTDGRTFGQSPGTSAFSRVAYEANGTLWGTGSNGTLWKKRAQGAWEKTKGARLRDVAAGPQGGLYLTDVSGGVWYSNWGEQFIKVPGEGFANISVAPSGIAWAAGSNGTLWRMNAAAKAPAPPPKPPGPPTPPAPPKQEIKSIRVDTVKGVADFIFETTVSIAPSIEISKQRPVNNQFRPEWMIARASGPLQTRHRIRLNIPKTAFITYYYVITAGPTKKIGQFSSPGTFD